MLGVPDATVGGRVLDALAGCLPPDYPWPGNMREREQAVRRVLLTGRYDAAIEASAGASSDALLQAIDGGRLGASALLARYCQLLYKRLGTYEEVARRTGLDGRTARKYVHQHGHYRSGVAARRGRTGGVAASTSCQVLQAEQPPRPWRARALRRWYPHSVAGAELNRRSLVAADTALLAAVDASRRLGRADADHAAAAGTKFTRRDHSPGNARRAAAPCAGHAVVRAARFAGPLR
ncbi:MAG: hypothetical protein AW07_02161 [Candidatus Accumulibacter sp. SK-11]|nr:MAG: hypothetical protein AW07_02161 [Candidatus Accumulibacter sp. SK-11]